MYSKLKIENKLINLSIQELILLASLGDLFQLYSKLKVLITKNTKTIQELTNLAGLGDLLQMNLMF